jgi:selenocysteine-specific translation elongation factor
MILIIAITHLPTDASEHLNTLQSLAIPHRQNSLNKYNRKNKWFPSKSASSQQQILAVLTSVSNPHTLIIKGLYTANMV